MLKVDAEKLPASPSIVSVFLMWVTLLAIGNPFNIGQTITQGIISATGRVGLSPTRCKTIQTDASINEGNSGALINTEGELVVLIP